jgi:ADP-ribose diphosphatase
MTKGTLYHGHKVDLEVHRFRTPAGHWIERERIVHPGAVAIVPFLDADTVCLIRNYRYAVEKELVEIPAGTLDPEEAPAVCAARELQEETGYRAGRLEPLCGFYFSPGILTEYIHAFAAHDLEHVGQCLEPDEQITILPTPWPEALAMVRDGRISDAKTVAALLYYGAFRR